ncbi:SUF system Fe-S cluster assembly protein [Hirschia baltica]|uniref:FeS assembly SUF system protein n=1 Tax=Hirschia baltica (strain ATCC 49814 / DSM 5838 / IFAM 1418) TaxID=582402 RepID=C6XJ42_HIRBI|nr:SUF system Fe-S cluster assembly protein [Hirschia baltica]ACT59137.1 FeS assembly SUF system protein [Hirschia baltica ATCC 49814]
MADDVKRDVIEPDAPEVPASKGPIPQDELNRITDGIIARIKEVYDPEIPVDVYELGLIYKVDLNDDRHADVEMTLTAPGCPVAGEMPGWVEEAVLKVDGVHTCKVSLVFDPPWDASRMSDEARLQLNML